MRGGLWKDQSKARRAIAPHRVCGSGLVQPRVEMGGKLRRKFNTGSTDGDFVLDYVEY